MKKTILLTASIVAVSASAFAQSLPPGIPLPPFDHSRACGATTITVPSGGTIPSPIPAGATVQISGAYSGEKRIAFAGTASSPACLRGPSASSPVNSVGEWQVSGTYGILENVKFQGQGLVVLGPANAIVVRDVEVTGVGQQSNSATAITTWSSANTSNIVFLRMTIHDNGPMSGSGDPDNHGIFIGPNRGVTGKVANVWVLASFFYRNSGDGIQVNGEETGLVDGLHHVYLVGNDSAENRQGGFWTKNAQDVVMAYNEAHDNVAHGFGYQYDPQRVWIINNESYRNGEGLRSGSRNNDTRRDVYVLGNLFRNNKAVGVQVNDTVAGDFVIAHNTVVGNPKGIENGYGPAAPIVSSNVVEGGIIFNQGGSPPTLRNNLLNAASLDANYYPIAGGAAVDTGVAEAAYEKYRLRYGIGIQVDAAGTTRPQGAAWDVGAFEYKAGPPPPPPSPSPTPPPASPSPSPSTPPSPPPCPTCPAPLAPSFSFPTCTGGVRSTSQVSQAILPDGRTKRVLEVKTTEGRCRIEVFSER